MKESERERKRVKEKEIREIEKVKEMRERGTEGEREW